MVLPYLVMMGLRSTGLGLGLYFCADSVSLKVHIIEADLLWRHCGPGMIDEMNKPSTRCIQEGYKVGYSQLIMESFQALLWCW